MRLTRLLRRALLTAFVCAASQAAGAADLGSLLGQWITPDREGVIDIAACGAGLCGRIVGMSETTQPDGSVPRDKNGVPQCGLTILRLPTRSRDGVWSGRIENPGDGSTWRCEVWRDTDGVHLRGYVLLPLLGRVQLWKQYAGALSPDCRLPPT